MFPLMSVFTGMNAVDPSTSEIKCPKNVYNTVKTEFEPKKGTISLHAFRKSCVGMSSPSETGRNLCFASENSVISFTVDTELTRFHVRAKFKGQVCRDGGES